MKFIFIIMSFFSFLFGSGAQQNDTITILDKPSFKMAINTKKVQLIDVRTPNEFNFFNQSDFIKEFNKLNKEEPVYLYCRSGNRSQKAARKLDSLGFKKIFDLKGGYMNWN